MLGPMTSQHGPIDIARVAERLRAASDILLARSRVPGQDPSTLPPPMPPAGATLHFGGYDATPDLLLPFAEALSHVHSAEAKLALASTCKGWHQALLHPAYWASGTLDLPVFKKNDKMTIFLQRHARRLPRARRLEMWLPGFRVGPETIKLLFETMPLLEGIAVVTQATYAATIGKSGDDFAKTLASAGGSRLHHLEFRGVLLSSSCHRLFREPRARYAELHTPGIFSPPDPSSEPPRAWFAQLRTLKLFNFPPCFRVMQPQPAGAWMLKFEREADEVTASRIVTDCKSLASLELHNQFAPRLVPPLPNAHLVSASSSGLGAACTTCGSRKDGQHMLLCDGPGCDQAFHTYCLEPRIQRIPKGDWFCPACSCADLSVDVEGSRTGLPALDADQLVRYRRSLPTGPSVRGDSHVRSVFRDEDFY